MKKVIFVSVFLATSAEAAPPDCRKVAELNEAVQSCEGNRKYVEAGRSCVRAFQGYLRAEKEAALRSMAALQAGGTVASDKHGEAVLTLSKVIETGEQASTSVKAYLSNIVYPEDWDAPPEVIGNPADFFRSHKCYSESRDGLEALAEEVDSSVKLLVEALSARPPGAAKPVH